VARDAWSRLTGESANGISISASTSAQLPVHCETVQDTLVLRLTTPPLRLAQLRPDVSWPEAVQRVLDGALARRPADRYARAGEFTRDLAAAFGLVTSEAGRGPGGGLAAASDAPTQVLAANGLAALAAAETRAIPLGVVPSTRVGEGEGPGTRNPESGRSVPPSTGGRRGRRGAVALATAVVMIGGVATWQLQAPEPAAAAASAPPVVGANDSATRYAAPLQAESRASLASDLGDSASPTTTPRPPQTAAAPPTPVPRPTVPESPAATDAGGYAAPAMKPSREMTVARVIAAAGRVVEDAGLDRPALSAALLDVESTLQLVAPASDDALMLRVAHGLLTGLSNGELTDDACRELRDAASDPRTPDLVPAQLRSAMRMMFADPNACG
jgi:hypothetical protein